MFGQKTKEMQDKMREQALKAPQAQGNVQQEDDSDTSSDDDSDDDDNEEDDEMH